MTVRFATVSDGHWGINDTMNGDRTDVDYTTAHQDAADRLNAIHGDDAIDFIVMVGDTVHDDETLHSTVINQFIDELDFTSASDGGSTFFGAFGNHDWSTESEWQSDYGHSRQHSFEWDNYGFILCKTGVSRSNESTTEDAKSDATWIEDQIDAYESDGSIDAVVAFHHIPPTNNFSNCPDMPDTRAQFERDIVKAVCMGHKHNRNDPYTLGGVDYYFCPLIGNFGVNVPRGVRVTELP